MVPGEIFTGNGGKSLACKHCVQLSERAYKLKRNKWELLRVYFLVEANTSAVLLSVKISLKTIYSVRVGSLVEFYFNSASKR